MEGQRHLSRAIARITLLSDVTFSGSVNDDMINVYLDSVRSELVMMVNANRRLANQLQMNNSLPIFAAPSPTVQNIRPATTPITVQAVIPKRIKLKAVGGRKMEQLCPSDCTICQETPKHRDAICTDCNHYFCTNCWNQWMNSSNNREKSCPTCRKHNPNVSGFKLRAQPRPRSRQPVEGLGPAIIEPEDDLFAEEQTVINV